MPSASAIRVMIVDDQPSMRALVRRSLLDCGFTNIRDEADGRKALAALRSAPAHLILSDYNMPEYSGLDFLKDVRTDDRLGKTAFIMLTGSSDREVVQKAAALGVNNYIVKPFNTAALKQKIERVFGALN
jgi:two-component system, chemotaxis family, chemotaxis protein CheY